MSCSSGDATPNYHNILTYSGSLDEGGALPANTNGQYVDISGLGTCNHLTSAPHNLFNTPSNFNTLTVGGGANTVYRCTTAGTLPLGALTVTASDCGASVATALQVN